MKVFAAMRAFIFLMWSGSALAGPLVIDSIKEAPEIWVAVMCTFGTIVAVLSRIQSQIDGQNDQDETKRKKPLTKIQWWLLIASQAATSLFAGVIFFLLGLHFQMGDHMLFVTVALASIGGAKSVEFAMNKWMNK